ALMTLRIVADVNEDGTTIRLIGHMQAEHIAHVRAEIAASRVPPVLDLDEVMLADVEAVRFLVAAERDGVILQRCAPFIREWMRREADVTHARDPYK
ncbi:MAG TPA: hypothetical protein VKC35_03320, partial [Vicinamibacterales bacterium]|nr:hypothetical protein [Vicinamibacterales bacterium]